MFQDLMVVVASALLAPVVGIGVVALIRKIRWSLASRAEDRVLSQPSAEQLTSNRVASATITQPTPIEGAAPADSPGPVSVDRPAIVIIGGQPIAWDQPKSPPRPRVPFDPADLSRSTPAWPRLVRNAGAALLAVAVVAIASIAISSTLATATPSSGVLGATNGIASSGPVSSPTVPGTTRSEAPVVSAAVIAALRGTAVVNDRLAVDADILQTERARKGVRAIDLARQLSSLVSDAELGASLANRLEAWPDADPLRSDLKSFYQAVAETIPVELQPISVPLPE